MNGREARRRAAVLSCQTMAKYIREYEPLTPDGQDVVACLERDLETLATLIKDKETTT